MKEPRDEDFSSLQTLLRLKRYETPPADSVEDFLFEFHRRQRAELLRRPLWRIALDRVESLFAVPTFAAPRLAYAGSCAVALTLAATGMLSRGYKTPDVAKVPPAVPPTLSEHIDLATPVTVDRGGVRFAGGNVNIDTNDFRFSAPAARGSSHSNPAAMTTTMAPASRTYSVQPRYVLESQPVRYEPRSSTF